MNKLWIALILCSANVYAGDDHNHEASVEPAPHGGTLRDAPPYKAELVLTGDQAKIYIYDPKLNKAKLESAKISATELKGQFKTAKQKKTKDVTFKKKGDAFEGLIVGASKVHRYDLHVYLIEGGKKTILDFGVDNIH